MAKQYSNLQNFQYAWAKTYAYAKQQGIPQSAIQPVFEADSQSLLTTGNPKYSQAERIQAIGAAYGLAPTTALPQDNPSPSDVLGNVYHNVSEIFTGLNPYTGFNSGSIAKNLWDTVTHSVEDPKSVVMPGIDWAIATTPAFLVGSQNKEAAKQDFTSEVMSDHNLWAFVPGAVDEAQLYRGKQGLRYMADNPVTSILDIMPLTRVPMKILARTDTGAAIAAKAAIAPEELGHQLPGQLAWKLIKNRPTNMLRPVLDENKNVIIPRMTVGETVDAFRNFFSSGREQAEINKSVSVHTEQGTREVQALAGPFVKAWNSIKTDEEKIGVYNYLKNEYRQTDFRPVSQIVSDDKWSLEQKDAIDKTLAFDHWRKDTRLNAGDLVLVHTPYGLELYLEGGVAATAVRAARDQMEAALAALEKGSRKFRALLVQQQNLDSIVGSQIARVTALRQNIFDSIQASLGDPSISTGPVADKLRSVLPTAQKWTRTTQQKSKNLEAFLGLDERTEDRVYRGAGKEVAPFTGQRSEWTDAERSAWYESEKMLTKTLPDKPTRAQIKHQATLRLKLTGAAKEVKVHAPVPAGVASVMLEVAGPHGLVAQIIEAFNNQEMDKLKDLTAVADRKLSGKAFQSPTRSPGLVQLQDDVKALKKYAANRQKVGELLKKHWYGVDKNGKKIKSGPWATSKSLSYLVKDVGRTTDRFKVVSTKNPPAIWNSLFQQETARLWIEHEAGRVSADAAIETLRTLGVKSDVLDKLGSDPQALREMIYMSSKVSLENPMLENVEYGVAREIAASAYESIADMRARGLEPLYMTNLSIFDQIGDEHGKLFNIFMGRTGVKKESALHEKSFEPTASVNNMVAAMLKEVKEYVIHNHELDFQEHDVQHFLFDRVGLEPAIWKTFQQEFDELVLTNHQMNPQAFFEKKLEDMNLKAYDPRTMFSVHNPRFDGGEFYIDKDIAKALTAQFSPTATVFDPISKIAGKGTALFRESILGYSPRYLAHIAIGGSALIFARAHPSLLKHISEGAHIAWSKRLPEDIQARYALKPEDYFKMQSHGSNQEGWSENILRHAQGYSAGQLVIQEWIGKLFGQDSLENFRESYLKFALHVIPNITYRMTRFTTNMQEAAVCLDGIERAGDHFYETTRNSDGEVIRVRRDMTQEQRLHAGAQAVDKVMGDVLAMAPIERQILTRLFPFWSWTKHILRYVATYPNDHPYRAMMYSQLSRISAQEEPAGLPLRTQLLFFLNEPNSSGQVNAIDVRAANPLRDTASYMTLGGWLSAMNPIITAPLAKVNPNFTFGSNVLYPNVQYNQIYGSNEAGESGTWLNSAEQIVPEVTALDQAFNLSGQFNYLQGKGERAKLQYKVMQSLNIPFLDEQSINLRQISATQEVDRYKIAEQAARDAWDSGNFSQLQGYSTVPDPRNTQNEITPARLEAVYRSYSGTGLPSSAVAPSIPSPTY